MPTFYKCPIWQELCPAVSLKVLVQIPSSNVNLIQILNDPNYAFQIVSSHIIFRGNRGLCFINSTGNRWRKTGKSCTASFFFIVTHYSRFCSLISASSSLSMHGEKGGSCSTSAFMVCFLGFLLGGVSPRIAAKEQLQLNVLSFISISMQRFEIRPPAGTTPIFNLAPQPQADNQPQRIVSGLKSLVVPYLAASPQSQDKVLFSQLTGGWCWAFFTPPICCPSMVAKGHS